MSTVRGVGVGQVGGVGFPERTSLESAPGFGDSLDALLRPQRPAAAPGAGTREIQFSRHAQARMESRGIQLDEQDLSDLGAAVERLAQRGAKESLVLMDDNAFIVGVPDRRVVTMMTRNEAAGNIFTQIDSTVVVR
jgi:flagellar operon protein